MRFLCIFYIKSPASPIFTDSSSAYIPSNVPQYNILKPNLAVFSQTVQPDKKFCFLYQVHYLCEHLHMTICLLFTVMLFAIRMKPRNNNTCYFLGVFACSGSE